MDTETGTGRPDAEARASTRGKTRTEHDLIGTMEIPADDLRGIHTLRALANFAVSLRPVHPRLVRAYALVKMACARTNRDAGYLDAERADAIGAACAEVARGEHAECFTVDSLQGGAGTSTNMNLNEVVANRANLLLGRAPGCRDAGCVHPLDHVNLHQSTNDTYPTALRVCLVGMIRELAGHTAALQGELQKKEAEFDSVITTGRTELQDAVPMTLGAIFSGFAEAAGRDRWRAFKCEERIRAVNLGGTAVGTGLAAPREYIFRVADALREITGFPLARAENLVDATANADAYAEIAGILSAQASNILKTARDLRLLAHERDIAFPPLQAGSSIMPGKINPVACEAAIQAAMRARADCSLVAEAASHGTLQINEYLPLIADSLTEALDLLSNATVTLARLVASVTADGQACAARAAANPVAVTAFLPHIGYDRAQELLAEWGAADRETGFRDFLSARLGAELVDRTLSPESLSALGFAAPKRARNQGTAT